MIAKFLSKYLFWVLQFFGWGGFALLVVSAGGFDPDPIKALKYFLPMAVFGVLLSTFLRWILKTKVAKFQWGRKKVLYIILANFFCIILSFFFVFIAAVISGIIDAHEQSKNVDKLDDIFFIIITAIVMAAFLLFLWTLFYYGIKYLIKYNKARVDRLQLKEAIKSAQLKTLKGHIHPQFLVTSLKNIKELMLADIKQARAMITALSELLRYSLTKNDETPITIANEMEMVQNYQQILSVDEMTKVSMNTSILNDLEAYTIPPMLLLNLIILGSKYSVDLSSSSSSSSSSEKELNITINEVNNNLNIEVSFNGKLIQGVEVKNIENSLKQRLLLLYGLANSYAVSYSESITSLVVSIPSKVTQELNTDHGIN